MVGPLHAVVVAVVVFSPFLCCCQTETAAVCVPNLADRHKANIRPSAQLEK